MRSRITWLMVGVALLTACGSGGGSASTSPSTTSLTGYINVFAATSLTASFNAMGTSFHRANPGVGVNLDYAGSPTLVTQIEQGAPADVFASADAANMTRLAADGYTTGASQVFAHNQLEIVVAPGNPKGITGLADLSRPGLIYISAGPTVPAGAYALQALATAGVKVTPSSQETSVAGVISKVELGEADAGIVYTTDVTAAGSKVQGVPIPASDNVIATYPIVAVKGTKSLAAANAFIGYLLSAAGQSTLQSFGFLPAS